MKAVCVPRKRLLLVLFLFPALICYLVGWHPHVVAADGPPGLSADFELFDPAAARPTVVPIAQLSGEVNAQAASVLGVSTLVANTGASGHRVSVAIIGSGIDPGHADLQRTAGGLAKLVEWADFTDEGLVTTEAVVATKGWADTRFGRLRTGSIKTAGGGFRVGVFRESSLDDTGAMGQDVNGNDSITDVFPVLVADPAQRGVYTRVYVDTNQNRDFTDEVPLALFTESGGFSRFRDRSGAVAAGAAHFVVAGISQDGSSVRLGFDSLGTGTFLGGLVAGWAGQDGMTGIAPGASLMSLKVLDSTGWGSAEGISRALSYAAERGARVILVDTGSTRLADEQVRSLREQILGILDRSSAIVIFPAGDGGPALESCRAPTDSVTSVAVGGVTGPAESLRVWSRNAVGPTPAGGWAPDFLAPLSAASTAPGWMSRGGYALGRGTSIAAAYAAGAAALLLHACDVAGLRYDARAVLSAMIQSSAPIAGATLAEQGGGVLNVAKAFDLLKAGYRPPMTVVAQEPSGHREGGLYARGFVPGSAVFYVDNFSGEPAILALQSGAEWVAPRRENLVMPAVGERSVVFEYGAIPAGLQCGVVRGVDERDGRTLMLARQTIVNAGRLPLGGTIWSDGAEPLKPGGLRRHFVLVPYGCTMMSVEVANGGREPVEVRTTGPGGRRSFAASVAAGAKSVRVVDGPEYGVWEVDVLRDEGDADVPVVVGISGSGFMFAPWPPQVQEAEAARESGGSSGAPQRVVFGLTNYLADGSVRLVANVENRWPGAVEHERIVVPRGRSFSRAFTVGEGVARLVAFTRHASSARADVDMFLHVFDPQAGWREVASSTTAGSSAEMIELEAPAPGSYMLFVEAREAAPGQDVLCELSLEAYADDAAVDWEQRNPVYIGEGEVLPVSMVVPAADGQPAESDLAEMEIAVVDEATGAVLAAAPLVIPGAGEALWTLQAGAMADRNRRFITIRTAGNAAERPDVAVMVNGRTYALDEGAVTLAVPVPGSVEVTLLVRGKPAVSKTLFVKDLPSASAKTPEPSSDPEKDRLREGLIRRLGR